MIVRVADLIHASLRPIFLKHQLPLDDPKTGDPKRAIKKDEERRRIAGKGEQMG
jgi:hypothetical protein